MWPSAWKKEKSKRCANATFIIQSVPLISGPAHHCGKKWVLTRKQRPPLFRRGQIVPLVITLLHNASTTVDDKSHPVKR